MVMRVVASVLCGVIGLGLLFGGAMPARRSGATHPVVGVEADRVRSPVLWVRSDARNSGLAGSIAGVAGALAGPIVGEEVSAVSLDEAPELAWWRVRDESQFQLGLDLSELRARVPERFGDQRVNEALHALGLANARGLVLEIGGGAIGRAGEPRVMLTVSYRAWAADRSRSLRVSEESSFAGANRVVLSPRWEDWIERGIACHRALLQPLDRSPFDAARAAWERRHAQRQRQLLAALAGPIVVGGAGQDGCLAYALVGLGPRADAGLVMRTLAIVAGPLCSELAFDVETGVGRASVALLEGTAFGELEWSLVEFERKRWVLVTRAGEGEEIAGLLAGAP